MADSFSKKENFKKKLQKQKEKAPRAPCARRPGGQARPRAGYPAAQDPAAGGAVLFKCIDPDTRLLQTAA